MASDTWTVPSQAGNVRSRKVADLVALQLRRSIASGELNEGDWLPTEPELTAQFGVSRPTLREAFRLLEADGLVQIRRGPPGGALVTKPGPEHAAGLFGLILTLSQTTLSDVYEARMVIEPPAVGRLAESASSADVEAVSEAAAAAADAVEDPEKFTAASVHFHLTLVQLSGNHTLAAVASMLSEITSRHVALGFRESRRDRAEIVANNKKAVRAFDKLAKLIEAGNGAQAEAYWRKHMEAALTYLTVDAGAAHAVIDVLD